MSLRFIINIENDPKDKWVQEIEFWPGRQKAQAREITNQGVVRVDREMDMQEVIKGLLGAIEESRKDKGCTGDDHAPHNFVHRKMYEERDATVKALTARIKTLTEVAAAAHDRLETYKRGEMTTKRDSFDEWEALRSALLVAGMLKEDL